MDHSLVDPIQCLEKVRNRSDNAKGIVSVHLATDTELDSCWKHDKIYFLKLDDKIIVILFLEKNVIGLRRLSNALPGLGITR